MKKAEPLWLAEAAFDKHAALRPELAHYTGIVSLHGLSRLAVLTEDVRLLEKIRQQLQPFLSGEREFGCNFPNYRCGGNASAYLLWKGLLPSAKDPVRRHVDAILNEAPRDPNGILCHPNEPAAHKIWIDVAFAVSPFLLFSGLHFGDERAVEDAIAQTLKMVEEFQDPDNGLLHQCKNFKGPGQLSEDHWSRGNGWGAYGLTELAVALPQDHPQREKVVDAYRAHVQACAEFQDADGLWHQEMTERLAYVETSGSALLLYALGAGIAAGLIDRSELDRFERGLRGLLPYITEELDIHHTCMGCLSPGNGTKLDYMARKPVVNDVHAFGPVCLAFGQAHALGIEMVERN